jgi:hypothetical protein
MSKRNRQPCRNGLAFIVAILALLICAPQRSVAQDKPDKPVPKPDAAQTAQEPVKPDAQKPPDTGPQKDENPKRILGIIPNFQTTNDVPENQGPLTPKEKYVLAWHQMFDFSAHFGNAFQSALQQASNGEPHYGQGWGAYGQRFAASEADQVTSSLLIFGVIPHLMKQDPRYFRKGKGSVWSRVSYAASRTVIARSDSGHAMFNYGQVFGQLGQAGISNLYYPKEDRDLHGTFQGWGINLAYTCLYNVLKEYYPDTLGRVIHHYAHRKPKEDSLPIF